MTESWHIAILFLNLLLSMAVFLWEKKGYCYTWICHAAGEHWAELALRLEDGQDELVKYLSRPISTSLWAKQKQSKTKWTQDVFPEVANKGTISLNAAQIEYEQNESHIWSILLFHFFKEQIQ